jgi:hypothetical protein
VPGRTGSAGASGDEHRGRLGGQPQPEGQALTTVTGFYGTAIGAAGGGILPWAGAPGSGDQGDGEDGAEDADGDGDATPPQDAGQRARPRPERNDQNDAEDE